MEILLLISSAQISIILIQLYYTHRYSLKIKTMNKELEQHTATIKKLEDILFGFDNVRFPALEQDLSVKEKLIYREIDEMHKEIALIKRSLEGK